jgi:hypothetical protein
MQTNLQTKLRNCPRMSMVRPPIAQALESRLLAQVAVLFGRVSAATGKTSIDSTAARNL